MDTGRVGCAGAAVRAGADAGAAGTAGAGRANLDDMAVLGWGKGRENGLGGWELAGGGLQGGGG